MANPLRIKTSSGLPNTTNFTGLQEFSNAELEYVIDKVFTRHAQANNRPGVLGFDSANGASIGSFINTRRTESVGDHPAVGGTNSVTTHIYANTTAMGEGGMVRPLQFDTSNTVNEVTDTQLNNGLMTVMLNKIAATNSTNYQVGQYFLGTAAPSGGTWSSKGSFVDTGTHDGSTVNTYQLWRKTASGSSHTQLRPLKASANSTVSKIEEMTDVDILTLSKRLANRIIATGIGTYKLQANAPGTGTWVQVSDSLIDTVADISAVNYSNQFTGQFSRQFTRVYSDQYTRQFTRQFTGNYARQFKR